MMCWHKWTKWKPLSDLRRYADTNYIYVECKRECEKCGKLQFKIMS